MATELSPGMKRGYLGKASDTLAQFNAEGSFTDQLNHVLNSYGTLSKLARIAVADLLEHLPLKHEDPLHNAFVARRILLETRRALIERADALRKIDMLLWEDATDGQFDADVRVQAYEYDGIEPPKPKKYRRPPWGALVFRSQSNRPRQPAEMLVDGIGTQCLEAMQPLLGGRICRTRTRRNTLECIDQIRQLAAEIGSSFDEDELILT